MRLVVLFSCLAVACGGAVEDRAASGVDPGLGTLEVPAKACSFEGALSATEVFDLGAARVRDFTATSTELAWIEGSALHRFGAHGLETAPEPISRLAAHGDELRWARPPVLALAFDASRTASLEGDTLVVSARGDETKSTARGAFLPVLAIDAHGAWTAELVDGRSVLREHPHDGSASVALEPVMGTATRVLADPRGVTALTSTGAFSLLVDWPSRDALHPRTLFQTPRIADVITTPDDTWFTAGHALVRARRSDGRIEIALHGTCELGAIAVQGARVAFVAQAKDGARVFLSSPR